MKKLDFSKSLVSSKLKIKEYCQLVENNLITGPSSQAWQERQHDDKLMTNESLSLPLEGT